VNTCKSSKEIQILSNWPKLGMFGDDTEWNMRPVYVTIMNENSSCTSLIRERFYVRPEIFYEYLVVIAVIDAYKNTLNNVNFLGHIFVFRCLLQ